MAPTSAEEILIIGEIVRLKMHKDPALIKDRRYHLRTYSCCFVGRDIVEWLVKNGEASNQIDAVACMRILQDNGILHHVCDDHIFKNEYLFYRFRIDDGTFFVDTEYENYHQAIMIHQRILGDSENYIMEDHVLNVENTLNKCFIASQFVSWLLLNNVVRDRYSGITLGQHFLDILVIRPVACESPEFLDDNTVFRFVFDLEYPQPLYKALNIDDIETDHRNIEDMLKKLTVCSKGRDKKYLSKLWKGVDEPVFEKAIMKGEDENKNKKENISSLKPVVLRPVTVSELMDKASPYYWKNIRITSDSVGFGFVIRGDGPCYVQAVDPTGPASAAGLKVRMYLYSVNGKVVLEMPHVEVAQEIMKGFIVDLVVLQHFRSSN